MRRAVCALAAVLVLAALTAGCGGGGKSSSPATTAATATTPRPPKDPGMAVIRQAVEAVRTGNRAALWNLLSAPSRRRLGPSFAAFRRRGALRVERSLRPFTSRPYHRVVSQRITPDPPFALVAIASGRQAYAAPLRREGGQWKLELGPGPLRIVMALPPPRSVSKVAQLAFELHGPQAGVIALLYADHQPLEGTEYTAPRSATIVANLTSPLRRGTHTGVAFATAGDAAVARAWTFLAR